MSAVIVKQIESGVDEIEQKIIALGVQDPESSRRLSARCGSMVANIRIQSTILTTAYQLQNGDLPFNAPIRIKNVIWSAFTPNKRRPSQRKRLETLRTLKCDVLKFVGLAFTVDNLLEDLTREQFQHLVTLGDTSFGLGDVFDFLYCDKIHKVVDEIIQDVINKAGEEIILKLFQGTVHNLVGCLTPVSTYLL